MLAEERRIQLIEWTREEGRIDAGDAAGRLEVAVETVRRDLDVLQRRGALRRVHGGAIALERFAREFTIPERENRYPVEKQQIGEIASRYVPEEGAIFVDGGTTTACMSLYLRDKPKLMVITNNLSLARDIGDSGTKTYMLAGRIRPATMSTVGARTVEDLRELNAVVSFVGVNGASHEGGLTAYDSDEALVKKMMMKNSVERIMLADHSKFGSSYPSRFAEFADFDRLVTSVTTPESYIDAFTSSGVEVVLA